MALLALVTAARASRLRRELWVVLAWGSAGATAVAIGLYFWLAEGGLADALFAVTVTLAAPPPNRPPVAVDDTATTAFATPVTINVLANDTDADRDALVITGVSPPANGSAERGRAGPGLRDTD